MLHWKYVLMFETNLLLHCSDIEVYLGFAAATYWWNARVERQCFGRLPFGGRGRTSNPLLGPQQPEEMGKYLLYSAGVGQGSETLTVLLAVPHVKVSKGLSVISFGDPESSHCFEH